MAYVRDPKLGRIITQCAGSCECVDGDMESLVATHTRRIAYLISKRMLTTPGRCYYGGSGAKPSTYNSTSQFLDVWFNVCEMIDRKFDGWNPERGPFWPYFRKVLNGHVGDIAWGVNKGFEVHEAANARRRQNRSKGKLHGLASEGDEEARKLIAAHIKGEIDLYPTKSESPYIDISLDEVDLDTVDFRLRPTSNREHKEEVIEALRILMTTRSQGFRDLRAAVKRNGLLDQYPEWDQPEDKYKF